MSTSTSSSSLFPDSKSDLDLSYDIIPTATIKEKKRRHHGIRFTPKKKKTSQQSISAKSAPIEPVETIRARIRVPPGQKFYQFPVSKSAQTYYLIKWANVSETKNTWQHESDILDDQLIEDFAEIQEFKWQFGMGYGEPFRWVDFGSAANKDMEAHFTAVCKDGKLEPEGEIKFITVSGYGEAKDYTYKISFNEFNQKNLQYDTVRPIRRIPVS